MIIAVFNPIDTGGIGVCGEYGVYGVIGEYGVYGVIGVRKVDGVWGDVSGVDGEYGFPGGCHGVRATEYLPRWRRGDEGVPGVGRRDSLTNIQWIKDPILPMMRGMVERTENHMGVGGAL